MSHAYRLSALRIASALELPELPAWDGPCDAPADVVFDLGEVPRGLDAPDHVAPIFQTKGRNEYLVALPGAGRILIRGGSTVTVDPEPGTDPTATRAFLTGPVQAVLWHQRGLLPLHASAISVGGRVLAMAGASGAGKSTLAAAFAQMGREVIADDICVVDVPEGSAAMVLPGIRRLRLWRDALDHLGILTQDLPRALFGKEKFLLDCSTARTKQLRKLAAVVLLLPGPGGEVSIERLRGALAVGAIRDIVHMRDPARALGYDAQIFAAVTQLIAGEVSVWRLTFPRNLACLAQVVSKILSTLNF